MMIQKFDIPVEPLKGFAQKPCVSNLKTLPGGDLVCGLAFASSLLFQVELGADSASVKSFKDLKISEELGEDPVAIMGGMNVSAQGELDLVVLHKGSAPAFLKSILSKDISSKSGSALENFLRGQEGGSGFFLRHSLVQVSKDLKFNVRRLAEGGILWDALFLGDYVFALSESKLTREPYLHLNPEKRETLRKDLASGLRIHRSEDGTLWATNEEGRLIRFQYTEHAGKPTRLKAAKLSQTASSTTDAWLYGISEGQKKLIRFRRNPISFEEELQVLWESADNISAIVSVDRQTDPKVVVTTESQGGARLYAFPTIASEDPEELPAIPKPQELGALDGVSSVSSLTLGSSGVLWAGESSWNSDILRSQAPRIISLSGI